MTPAAQAALIKVEAAMAAPLLLVMPFDAWWIMFVTLGLAAGWLARASRMVEGGNQWEAIRRDLLASVLAGGANGVISAVIIWQLDLNYLQGVAVACVCAFLGTGALQTVSRWAIEQASAFANKRDGN